MFLLNDVFTEAGRAGTVLLDASVAEHGLEKLDQELLLVGGKRQWRIRHVKDPHSIWCREFLYQMPHRDTPRLRAWGLLAFRHAVKQNQGYNGLRQFGHHQSKGATMRKMLYCDSVGNLGSIALLVLRIVVGAAFFMHGSEKVPHAFTWMNDMPAEPDPTQPRTRPNSGDSKEGNAATAERPPQDRVPHRAAPPGWLQATAAYAEYIGGPALVVGALTRFASLGII